MWTTHIEKIALIETSCRSASSDYGVIFSDNGITMLCFCVKSIVLTRLNLTESKQFPKKNSKGPSKKQAQEKFQVLLYNWEKYFIVIGWEQVNLSLIFNLHYSAKWS